MGSDDELVLAGQLGHNSPQLMDRARVEMRLRLLNSDQHVPIARRAQCRVAQKRNCSKGLDTIALLLNQSRRTIIDDHFHCVPQRCRRTLV